MKDLDIILYEALSGDPDLMQAVGNRIKSTSLEVSPDEQDNTPLPYIIVTDDGFQNNLTTKDDIWEGNEDVVQSSVEVACKSPLEVKQLVHMCRTAISKYVTALNNDGIDTPYMESVHSDGIAWDWMKPCYYTHLNYKCIIRVNNYE